VTGGAGSRMQAAAAALAFPRRAGSDGSSRVVELLVSRLSGLGFSVNNEEFSYDLSPVERMLRRILGGIACLVVAAGLLAGRNPVWSLGGIAAVFAIGGLVLGWSPRLERLYRRSGPTRTANVVGRRGATRPRRRVILMAHHDSKSQSLALPARMTATVGTLIGVFGVAAATGIELAGRSAPPFWLGPCAGFLGGLSLFALATMTSGNASPGGVDNAGSLAIVLELAARIGTTPPDVELVVLFTGAEEDHMVGAMRWLDAHADELAAGSTACLNFDGAGSPGREVLITRYGWGRRFAPGIERVAVECARELGIPVRRIVMAPAVGIDAIPFAHRGIECLTLSSGSLGRATAAVHSAGDVADNLDPATMERIVDHAGAVVERLMREPASSRLDE